MGEAQIVDTEDGKRPKGPGWFILNLGEVAWQTMERGGTWSLLEADDEGRWQQQVGAGVHVLPPGESPGFYHWESDQEGFLVLSGACLLIVEGEERPLKRWDYFHCPPGTRHIMVGVDGDEPCAIFMFGVRTPGKIVRYPADPVAARHGVSVKQDADNGREAYAQWEGSREMRTVPAPWPPADGR
jgi:uncharacterized cupin superfamily protein